ncbi:MAG: calcium/sodium antiporter [Clostridia bacterium]|nr:calcium/sodium antiporter [Clostridia bacterium]
MDILLLVLGIVFLIKGSDWFVEGASDIAKVFKIPSLIIGMTIVAFGTSAPEAAVSISASIQRSSSIALGNVIGSNIFNLLAVVGVSACIAKLNVENEVTKRDFPFNILATIAIIVCCMDIFTDASDAIIISRTDGMLLLCLFIVFMFYTVSGALAQRKNMESETPKRKILLSLIMLVTGIAGVVAGGKFTVDGASGIAKALGVPENLIALTIVAVGTSLPELVTSVTALKKGESDIAIGNVIGSNIFNLLFIVGLSASIRPLSTDMSSLVDSLILLAVNIVVYALVLKNKSFARASGIFMTSLYVVFAVFVVLRGTVL